MASLTRRNHAALTTSPGRPRQRPNVQRQADTLRGDMTAVWTLAMTAKEPGTLVMVTRGGTLSRSSGSPASNHG